MMESGYMMDVESRLSEITFFRDRRIFLTGHTGFKGSWLCTLLLKAGAEVTGFALPPEEISLFRLAGLEGKMDSIYGDIRNFDVLWNAFNATKPEIVIHMAAQPIVRESYRNPVDTYHTNVMGTVHILECIRRSDSVGSILNVTTDKVYENKQWPWGFRETDPLDGFDPYSNSKSCSELVTHSYYHSFLAKRGIAVSTARAGNVIGGGDFSADRILPDCVRAVQAGIPIRLRNPNSLRPYKHVLEPLSAYLLIMQRQMENPRLAGWYNVGPDAGDCISTQALAELFCEAWGAGACWECACENGAPHEDAALTLDCSKLRSALGWRPRWDIRQAVEKTVQWTQNWLSGGDISACMEQQIDTYFR